MFRQIVNLAQKEFLQIWRDRLLMISLILGPVLQFLLLGQSTSSDIRHLSMAVVDQDKSSLSRQFVTTLDNTPELNLVYYLESRDALEGMLANGQARVGVVIPPHFATTIDRGETAVVQILADSSNFIEGSTALRITQGAVADFISRTILAGRRGPTGGIDLRTNIQFNPTLNVRLYAIPAQLGFIVFQISMLVAALSFARERELGTLEQLQITPLRQVELILGKSILAMAIGLANFLILLIVTMGVFQVPLRGSLAELCALTVIFVAANVAMGMIISVLSGNQQQALLTVFLICVLEVNVSGYLVEVQNMPAALQFLAEFSPLRHYLTIIREVMLKGTSLEMLADHAVALALLTLASGAIAWGLLQRHGE